MAQCGSTPVVFDPESLYGHHEYDLTGGFASLDKIWEEGVPILAGAVKLYDVEQQLGHDRLVGVVVIALLLFLTQAWSMVLLLETWRSCLQGKVSPG